MLEESNFCFELADLINRLMQCCQKREKLLVKEAGITAVELRTMQALAENSRTMRELAAVLELSPSRITRIVDGLVEKKLIVRVQCPEDRRLCPVVLTEQGKDVLQKGERVFHQFQHQVEACFDAGERSAILNALKQLVEALQETVSRTPY